MITIKSAATLMLFEVLSPSNSTSSNSSHYSGDGHRHRSSSLTPFHKTIILGMVYIIVAGALLLICCWHIQVKEAGKRYVYSQIKDSKEENIKNMYTPIGNNSRRVISSQIVYTKSQSKKKSTGIAPSSSSSSEEDSDPPFGHNGSKQDKDDDEMEKGIALQDYHDDYSYHLNLSLSDSSKKNTSTKSSGRIPRIDPLRPPLHPFGTLQTPFQFGPSEVTSLKGIFPTAASYDATETDTKTAMNNNTSDNKNDKSPSPPPSYATPSPEKSTSTSTPSPNKKGDFSSLSLWEANHKFHRLMQEESRDKYVSEIDYFIRHRPDFYAPKYHYNIELLQQKMPPPSDLCRRRSTTSNSSPSKFSSPSSNVNNSSSVVIKNSHQQLAHHHPPSDHPPPKISHADFVRFLKSHPGQLLVSANHAMVSLVTLTPYQGNEEVIGYFRCANVACRVLEVHWVSKRSRKDTPEICPRCHRLVYPYEQQDG